MLRTVPMFGVEVPLPSTTRPLRIEDGEVDLRITAHSLDPTLTTEGSITLSVAAGVKGHYYQAEDWPETSICILLGDITSNGTERSTLEAMTAIAKLSQKYDFMVIQVGPMDTWMIKNGSEMTLGMIEDEEVRQKIHVITTDFEVTTVSNHEKLVFDMFLPEHITRLLPSGSIIGNLQRIPAHPFYNMGPVITTDETLGGDAVALFTYLPPLGVRDRLDVPVETIDKRTLAAGLVGAGNGIDGVGGVGSGASGGGGGGGDGGSTAGGNGCIPTRYMPKSVGSHPLLKVIKSALCGETNTLAMFAAWPPGNFGVSRVQLGTLKEIYGKEAPDLPEEYMDAIDDKRVFYVINCNVSHGTPGNITIRRPMVVEITYIPPPPLPPLPPPASS